MAQQTINIGTAPNDGTGDPIRTAFDKANQNFTELYGASALGQQTVIRLPTSLLPEDGMTAFGPIASKPGVFPPYWPTA